jgi:hypothetical protein
MRTSLVFRAMLANAVGAMLAASVHAAPIMPGDLVIQRQGSGTGALSSAAAATYLDEYAPNGTLVQSIPMNNTGTGSKLVNSGTGTSEGKLGVSENGQYVALFGYNATVGTSGVKSTVSRTIASVNVSTGNVAYTTGNLGGNDNARSVAVNNTGTGFWNTWGHSTSVAGGINYVTAGASPVVTSVYDAGLGAGDKFRALEIYGGQLYVSQTGSTPFLGLATVGTGLPTSTATLTNLPNVAGCEQFFFADLSPTVAGVDTLYTANYGDENGGNGFIAKYTYDGSTWAADGQISGIDSAHGLTGVVNGSSVTLYALYGSGSTDTYATYLGKATDASGYDGTLSGSLTLLATSPAHEAFRGIGYVSAAPEPSSAVLAGIAGLVGLIALATRRHRKSVSTLVEQ